MLDLKRVLNMLDACNSTQPIEPKRYERDIDQDLSELQNLTEKQENAIIALLYPVYQLGRLKGKSDAS